MNRALCYVIAMTVLLGCTPESTESAATRQLELMPEIAGRTPQRFDFEGTWTIAPGQLVSDKIFEGMACERQFGEENRLVLGRDTLVLKKGEITTDAGTITVPYTGTFSHWDGFGRNLTDGLGGIAYGCVAENINFDVNGELHIDMSTGFATFDAEGVATNSATYNHPTKVRFVPAPVGSPVDGNRNMFDGEDPDVALVVVGLSDYMGSTEIPDGCDFELDDVYYSARDSSRGCVGIQPAIWKFERVAGLPDISPRGEIKGRVMEALPDGTVTTRFIENAKVGLFRQPRHVRVQRTGESDEDYRAYLDIQKDERRFIRNVIITPDSMGRFTFEDLETLVRDPGQATTYREAEYTIEVAQARSEETTPDAASDNLLFEIGLAQNIRVGDDDDIFLRPFDALGQKIDIAERLKAKAPLGYGAAEDSALFILEQLVDGTRPMTPEANEAVRRAVWAEIAARDARTHADLLTGFMLDSFASLVTDFLIPDINLNPRNIAKAQKRIRDFSPEAAKSQSALDILQSGRVEEMHQSLARKPYAGLGKRSNSRARKAGYIKSMAKAAVFNPVKLVGANFSSNPDLVNSVVDAVQLAFDGLVDLVLTGNFGGVVKSVIKKRVGDTIKASKGKLVDNNSVLFTSFTQLSRAGLERTAENLNFWAVDDPVAYRADRNATLQALNRMNSEASDLIAAQELSKGLADGSSASEDAFAALNAIPAFGAAEKVAKVIKVLANVSMFIDPLVYTFFQLPTQVADIGYMTWGETRPIASPVVFSGPLVDRNGRLQDDINAAGNAYEERLNAIKTALRADDHEALFDLVHGTDSEVPLEELHVAMELGRDRAIDEVASWDSYEEWWPRVVTAQLARVTKGSQVHDAFVYNLATFIIEVLTGYFPDRDAWYRMRVTSVVASLDAEIAALPDFESAATALPSNGAQIAQLVRAERVRATGGAGEEFLTPGVSQSLVVTADISNLSVAPISGLSARLVATADSGVVAVPTPLQTVPGSLGPYDGSSTNTATLSWTVDYAAGDADDVVVLRVEFEEDGALPHRYNGAPGIAVFGPDPTTLDTDFDGLPDPWESRHGLPIGEDNWDADSDGDGAVDSVEFARGLNPSNPDTDGDGRNDGDELLGGAIGIASDPLVADTDGDGSNDGADLSPLDETSVDADSTDNEPCVAVEDTDVYLTPTSPAILIPISNACAGTLRWSARVHDSRLVKTWLGTNEQSGGVLVIATATKFDHAIEFYTPLRPTTTVTVFDVAGRAPDGVDITVTIGPPSDEMGGDMGTGLDPAGGDVGVAGNRDTGLRGDAASGGGGDADKSGCGCTAVSVDGTPPLLLGLLLVGGVRRRRRRRRTA